MLWYGGGCEDSIFTAFVWSTFFNTNNKRSKYKHRVSMFFALQFGHQGTTFRDDKLCVCNTASRWIVRKNLAWVLKNAVQRKLVNASAIFIDATYIKANANKKKHRKKKVKITARVYDERLKQEINADRENHNKKPLKEKENDTEKTITVSTSDPDCGLFHKGEHKVEFAYSAHTACDRHNFV